ncbi:MAG: branched-chain amino acid transport system II carrier protein [Verrucomicrobia bacterium]|nr:branched-chain amino acid transport system II carrier protein [Verrucomicrobiota bacterium]MBS0637275.1 branched-chain amino acid transport system II carrier protein [Verrucomicrobiota bacterium]
MTRALALFSVGMAMFSMFFGAGNVVFPLIIGQVTTDQSLWAMIGLVITAVGIPFTGVFAMALYDGNYKEFFSRLGKWPGFLIALIIMGLIGPFGCMPRCIALSYSTAKMFFTEIGVVLFSIICCLAIYATSIKKSRVIDFVGWILSPFFLGAIGFIVVMGLINHPEELAVSSYQAVDSFVYGLKSGYHTMDLLASFFFCSVVIGALRKISHVDGVLDKKLVIKNALIAAGFGAFLLAIVYVGMSSVAALHSTKLVGVKSDMLLGTVALEVLGPSAGIVTCLAVIMACLTTAIALAAVFSEFFQQEVMKNKISYRTSLILTLIVTFFVSTLEFEGIFKVLTPIVSVLYPALLILSLVNIAYKTWGFDKVKFPVASAFGMALLFSV